MTVREALRDAMAEEMRRDGDVFVMGEEVAEYQGAYKVTQGLLEEFGARARHRHADHRARLCRPRRRRRLCRAEADRRVHDLELRHAGDGPDHQLGGEDALHVGRPDGLPDRLPRAERRGRARRARSTARTIAAWYAQMPGLKVIAAVHRRRRQGPAQGGDPRPATRSSSSRTRSSTARRFEVPKLDDFVLPIGKAQIARAGQGRDDRLASASA